MTIDEVLAELAIHKGEFRNLSAGTFIRHKTETTNDGTACCPLAFLCKRRGFTVESNTEVAFIEKVLALEYDDRRTFTNAADGAPFASQALTTRIKEACL